MKNCACQLWYAGNEMYSHSSKSTTTYLHQKLAQCDFRAIKAIDRVMFSLTQFISISQCDDCVSIRRLWTFLIVHSYRAMKWYIRLPKTFIKLLGQVSATWYIINYICKRIKHSMFLLLLAYFRLYVVNMQEEIKRDSMENNSNCWQHIFSKKRWKIRRYFMLTFSITKEEWVIQYNSNE